MNKRKKIAILSFLAVLLTTILSIGVVIAYFSSKDTITNNFKIGDIQTEVHENFDQNTGEKEVWTVNPVDNDSLVRVSITVRLVDPEHPNDVLPVNLDKVKLIFIDNYSENWYKNDDGYYYYKKVLKGKGKTESLLKKVEIDEAYKEENQGMEIKVDVKSEAVQVAKYKEMNSSGQEEVKYVFNETWIGINDNIDLQNILKEAVDSKY